MIERDIVWPDEAIDTGVFKINGVPLIEQKHKNWCGYASLAMILQYWGYTDITPESIFEHLHGKYDEAAENSNEENHELRTPAPSIDTLALVTQELTPLTARIISKKEHDILKARKGITPLDTLDSYIIGKIPTIVRIPGHFAVVIGKDTPKNQYIFNDPLHKNEEMRSDAKYFENVWGFRGPNYPRDTRHLMLAVYPKR